MGEHNVTRWLLPLLLLVGQLRPANSDQYNDYNYGGYGDYDGQEKQQIHCYSCHFSNLSGYQKGPTNCGTPFIADDIPTLTCEGACAILRFKVEGEIGYMVMRTCMPGCKDSSEDVARVECCHGDLCNGAR